MSAIPIVLSSILFFTYNMARAERTIWYVHPDSTLNSIQAALDSCADNDIVLVGPGIYLENIIWPNKQGIHLVSELGRDTTIIDGDNDSRVITIEVPADTTTLIRGFTIQNGANVIGGGGIYCWQSSPSLVDLNITSNRSSDFGGGIYLGRADSRLIDVNITGNNTWFGGGICFSMLSNAYLSDVTIKHNSSVAGGGIYCRAGSNPYLENVVIDSNSSGDGGGVYCNESAPTLNKVKITYNVVTASMITGGTGAGIHCYSFGDPILNNVEICHNTAENEGGGILCRYSSSPIIDSCTISNNTGEGVFSCIGSSPDIHYCNICNNTGYGICNTDSNKIINAETNWWGDASGPYHPVTNPGGQGDSVSDYVNYDPWLGHQVGVEEESVIKPVQNMGSDATVFSGPLRLPEGKKCRVFDITGRVVMPDKMRPGVYFVQIDGEIRKKVIKVR